MLQYFVAIIFILTLGITPVHALYNDDLEILYYWDKETIDVTLVNSIYLTDRVAEEIEKAVTSTEFYMIEDNLMHKDRPGVYSPYYLGWQGALDDTNSTSLQMNYNLSAGKQGDIVIEVTTQSHPDGISGITMPMFVNGKLSKVYITLFEIDQSTPNSIYGLTMHEFGHALGLGHSTADEDIMYEKIGYNNLFYPYVAPCLMQGLEQAYQGSTDTVTCLK
jgi:hypothetical protein